MLIKYDNLVFTLFFLNLTFDRKTESKYELFYFQSIFSASNIFQKNFNDIMLF